MGFFSKLRSTSQEVSNANGRLMASRLVQSPKLNKGLMLAVGTGGLVATLGASAANGAVTKAVGALSSVSLLGGNLPASGLAALGVAVSGAAALAWSKLKEGQNLAANKDFALGAANNDWDALARAASAATAVGEWAKGAGAAAYRAVRESIEAPGAKSLLQRAEMGLESDHSPSFNMR